MRYVESVVIAALLISCLVSSALTTRNGRLLYEFAKYKRAREVGHYNLHKCCLETGESHCCNQIRENSMEFAPEDYDDSDDADLLRFGAPNRFSRYNAAYDSEDPVEAASVEVAQPWDSHWKSRRFSKEFF